MQALCRSLCIRGSGLPGFRAALLGGSPIAGCCIRVRSSLGHRRNGNFCSFPCLEQPHDDCRWTVSQLSWVEQESENWVETPCLTLEWLAIRILVGVKPISPPSTPLPPPPPRPLAYNPPAPIGSESHRWPQLYNFWMSPKHFLILVVSSPSLFVIGGNHQQYFINKAILLNLILKVFTKNKISTRNYNVLWSIFLFESAG